MVFSAVTALLLSRADDIRSFKQLQWCECCFGEPMTKIFFVFLACSSFFQGYIRERMLDFEERYSMISFNDCFLSNRPKMDFGEWAGEWAGMGLAGSWGHFQQSFSAVLRGVYIHSVLPNTQRIERFYKVERSWRITFWGFVTKFWSEY